MVKVQRLSTDDADIQYAISSAAFSAIGTETVMSKFNDYLRFLREETDDISDSTELTTLYHISRIRDRSTDMLYNIDLLKCSLDRFLFAGEDTRINQRRRRENPKFGDTRVFQMRMMEDMHEL